jgi:hypothetical protein
MKVNILRAIFSIKGLMIKKVELLNPFLFLLTTILTVILIIGCKEEPTSVQETEPETKRIGFELVEIITLDSIRVWINDEPLTQIEFDSIQITAEWRKNQPREGDPDGSSFLRSPDAAEDGVFTKEEHFGYQWIFNAQIIQQNVPLPDNDDALLNGRFIAKYHQVQYNSGKTLYVLISPNGEEYIRVSRDANRTTDIPIIPVSWQIEERLLNEDLTIDLPNPTLNIRAENNQDSFQGPVTL